VIPAYLDTLARALSFDPSLSRRVRQEVEDHLLDAVAADPARDRREAERQAVARFGEPHAIAAEFTRVAAARQARSLAAAIVVMVFVVFIAMKARVAWYAATQWTMPEDMRPASRIVLLIDRYAFWTAVFLASRGLRTWSDAAFRWPCIGHVTGIFGKSRFCARSRPWPSSCR